MIGKIVKILLCVVGAILAFVLLLLLTLPLWLGPLVKPSADAFVPKMTGTSFHLGHLALNPYTGRFELGDTVLGNPKGYAEPTAFAISNLVVDVAMDTLGNDCIHIEEVTVSNLFVSYVKGGEYGVDNFLQIQYNVAGGREKFEQKKNAKKDAAKEKEAAKPAPQQPKAEHEDASSGKRVAIDRLHIEGIRVKIGPVVLPIPSLTLENLGSESSGLTWAELGERIWQAILTAAIKTGDGAKFLGSILGDGANLLGEGAGKAKDAVGESAKKTFDAAGEGTKKALDAAGESTKKAVDALKSFF